MTNDASTIDALRQRAAAVAQKQGDSSASLIVIGVIGTILTAIVLFGVVFLVRKQLSPDAAISRITVDKEFAKTNRDDNGTPNDLGSEMNDLPEQFDASKLFEQAVATATKLNQDTRINSGFKQNNGDHLVIPQNNINSTFDSNRKLMNTVDKRQGLELPSIRQLVPAEQLPKGMIDAKMSAICINEDQEF